MAFSEPLPHPRDLGRYVLAGAASTDDAVNDRLGEIDRRVTAVVVTYHSGKWLENCLSGMAEQRAQVPKLDVVIADNGSTDDTAAIARAIGARLGLPLHVIELGANLGYATACNAGIRWALSRGADYVLVSNPDVEYVPGALAEMMRVAQRSPTSGPVSPIHLAPERDRVEPGCAWCLKFSPGLVADFRSGAPVARSYRTEFVNGAIMLLSKSFIERVGEFDEVFFFYCEDNDLCRRGVLAGYWPLVATRARAVHWHATASGRDAFRRSAWRRANYTLILKKTSRPFALNWLYAVARAALDLREVVANDGEARRMVGDIRAVVGNVSRIRKARERDRTRLSAP